MQSHTPFSKNPHHSWPSAMKIGSPVPPNDENALCGVGIGKKKVLCVGGSTGRKSSCNLKAGLVCGGYQFYFFFLFCGIFSLFGSLEESSF